MPLFALMTTRRDRPSASRAPSVLRLDVLGAEGMARAAPYPQNLSDREGKVASRIALENDVWGYDYHGGSNVVDAVVRSLRKKLADQAALIETVHGTGYRLRRR